MSKVNQSTNIEQSLSDEQWSELFHTAARRVTRGRDIEGDLLSSDILFEQTVNRPGGKITLGVVTRGDLKILRDEYSSKNKSANLEDSVNYLKCSIESLLKQQSDQIASIGTKIEELKSPIDSISEAHITVKQFAEKYKISADNQRTLRTRKKDPLPYIQFNDSGNITYDVKKVDKWYENYIITHKGRRK